MPDRHSSRRLADWRPRLRWFAAEFLVVVTGVLVALLVNAWWSGLEKKGRESQALERLYHESEAIASYFHDLIAFHDRLIQAQEAAVKALEPGATADPDLDVFQRGVFFAFTYPAVNPPRSVYDEVTQSGLFGSLSSVEVRSAISRYYGGLDWIQSQLAFFRQTAQPGIELTMQFPYAYDSAQSQKMRILVEPALLRENTGVRHALIFGLRNQMAFQTFRQRMYDEAAAMCRTLAKVLQKQCDAAGAP